EVLKSVNTATMTSLTLPESITTIGYQALKDKTNLQVVNLPESLTTIEQEAFMSCTGIETLYIPASVTFIGAQALAYCSNLTTINFGGTRDQWTTLMSGAKNIMKSTSATVHCYDD
ncbi:MAG: leucine-rich repeat domain-containing protein, partial [Spirochaetales bacterium]|nr:leucine-rich repeat domain-containing protein [Spirochaetales bacterium]